MSDYNKIHKIWERAHHAGSPNKYVRNYVVFRELDKLTPGRTLDAGCGTGEYSVFLAQRCHKVSAFDPSEYAIAQLRQRNKHGLEIECQVNTLEKYKTSVQFDNIVSIEVMEHIEQDRLFGKQLFSLLKKNGSLLISVPAWPFLFSDGDKISGHYRRYTAHGLEKLLNDAGFREIKIKQYGFPMLFFYQLLSKFFFEKKIISHFSASPKKPDKGKWMIADTYRILLSLDCFNSPFFGVGFVATCKK